MTHKDEFITWYFNQFTNDTLFKDISSVTENSPWHREGNVGIHTSMVVAQYLARAIHPTWMNNSVSNGREFLLGAFAAAFHDVGKPPMRQIKHSEERGDYNAFHGHERRSARMWEEWAITNWYMLCDRFVFTPKDLHTIGWMIENHLPWGITQKDKVTNLALSIAKYNVSNAFFTLLMADTTGRISDDAEEKTFTSQVWVDNIHDRVIEVHNSQINTINTPDTLEMVMPIGPSGSGKSTLFNNEYKHNGYVRFSLDDERIAFAEENGVLDGITDEKEIYACAWHYAQSKESEFKKFWQHRFIVLIKSNVNIFCDNTNLTRKFRRFYIAQATSRNYRTKAIMMPTSKNVLWHRVKNRTEKIIPYNSFKQQYNSLQQPWYGEFDEIEFTPPYI